MSKKEILSLLEAAGKIRTSNYTEEMNNAIVEASNSDDDELNKAAWLAVHSSIRAYEDDFLKKFGVYKNSQDYEDYVNELFAVIMTDLKRWDPTIGAITTHFKPRFTKACIAYKNEQNSTFESTHYELVYVNIKKAKEALEQQGNYNPTPLEIRNYIATQKKPYSEQTIMHCLEQVKDISSIDASYDLSDMSAVDPVNHVISMEERDKIISCIESLEPQYRMIMEIEYRICREEGISSKKLTNRMIANEFRKLVGSASDEWIKNIRDAAERDFRHRYRTNYYHRHSQVNISPYLKEEYYTQTQEDIRNAIQEDINALFAADAG